MDTPETLTAPGAIGIWERLADSCRTEKDLLILQSGCESYQRQQEADQILNEKGLVWIDRFGQEKLRPEARLETDQRNIFVRCMKLITADAEVYTDEDREFDEL